MKRLLGLSDLGLMMVSRGLPATVGSSNDPMSFPPDSCSPVGRHASQLWRKHMVPAHFSISVEGSRRWWCSVQRSWNTYWTQWVLCSFSCSKWENKSLFILQSLIYEIWFSGNSGSQGSCLRWDMFVSPVRSSNKQSGQGMRRKSWRW